MTASGPPIHFQGLLLYDPRRGFSYTEEKGSQALGMVFQMLSQVPCRTKGDAPCQLHLPQGWPSNAPDVVTTPLSPQSLQLEPALCSALGPG